MPNIETSFIPEQGTTYQGGARRSTVATVFSVFITVIAILLTVGAWWLQQQEKKKVANLEKELGSMESKFDIAKISQLGQLDKRINVARDMFNKHSMPSLLIDYLSDHTVSSIKWKQVNYKRMVAAVKSKDAAAPAADTASTGDTLELQGESMGYGPLYQQLAHFRTQSSEVMSTELQSFRIDPRTNIVSMQIKLTIRPSFATFATLRARSSATPDAPVEAATPEIVPPTQVVPAQPTTPTPAPAPAVTPAKTTPVAPPTVPAPVPAPAPAKTTATSSGPAVTPVTR